MEIVVIVLAVVAVAAAVAASVFFVRGSKAKAGAEARVREAELVYEGKLKEAEGALKHANEVCDEKLKLKDEYIEKMDRTHAEAMKKVEDAHAESLRKADEVHAETVRKMEERQAEAMKAAAEQHAKDMEMMQNQFKVAAGEILSKNTESFSKDSSEKIDALLKPVREKFEEFSRKVEESDKGRVEMKTSIEEQVKSIMGQAAKVSVSADNLANALTSRPKMQGDFGELILKDILINVGMIEGENFQCQGVMTDENGHEIKSEDGKTMIPDVQVFYPDGSAVIVDSKVSLTDYVAYCSETDEAGRAAALKRHIESVRKHVNELADKDYTSYLPDGRRKVDYNIMFIPNDGAFLTMMDKAPMLWQEAMNRKVLIVSQMNLVVVLNMIGMAWRQAKSVENVDAIMAAATELMDKLQKWLVSYEKIGKQINDLSKTYDDSTNRLKDSNQSVIRKVQKLEGLNVTPRQKSLKATGRKTAVAAASESVVPVSLTPRDDPFSPAEESAEILAE